MIRRTRRLHRGHVVTLVLVSLLAACGDGDDAAPLSPENFASRLAAIDNCEELAEFNMTVYQAVLDEFGAESMDAYSRDGEVYDAGLAKLDEMFGDAIEANQGATVQRLGCTDRDENWALRCAGIEQLEPGGEAGEVFVEQLGSGCPEAVDDAALADGGLTDTVALPTELTLPTDLAAGEDALWIADFGAGRLLKVDPAEGRVTARSDYVGAMGAAVAPDGVWFTSVDGNFVTHADFEARTIEEVEVGTSPSGVAFGADAIWVANNDDATVSRIDPGTHRVVATIPVGTVGLGIPAFTHGLLWLPDFTAGTVHRIDPTTNSPVGDPIAVGSGPFRLAVGSGSVWVANRDGTTISRVDAGSGQVVATIDVQETVSSVAAANDSVWVATDEGSIVAVVPATAETSQVATVPGHPVDIAAAGDSRWVLWINDGGAGFVSRVAG